MLQIYELGQYFISHLEALGDWLMYEPFEGFGLVIKVQRLHAFVAGQQYMLPIYDAMVAFSELSIASLIFGGALTLILTYKFIKFLVDVL